MIWTFHRRRLKIFIIILTVILIGRWLVNLSIAYTVANYFHKNLSPTPQTQISYDISDINIHWLERKIDLSQVYVKVDNTENFKDTTSYELFIPNFSIDLLSTRDLLFHNTLYIEEVSIDYPQIQVYLPLLEDSLMLRKEVGDLQQKTLKFLQKLNLQHFEIRHGTVLWSTDGLQQARYQLSDVNVVMSDIDIYAENMSSEGVKEMLLADHVELTLHNDSLLLPDGQHTLHFKKLHISSKDNVVLIDSLHLFAGKRSDFEGLTALDNHIEIPSLYMKGVDFLSLYLDNDLLIDTVLVGDTELHIILDDETISLFQSDGNDPYHGLDSINIQHVKIIPSSISVNRTNQSTSNTIQMDSATLMLDNVSHYAEDDSSFSWGIDNLELQLKNYQAKLEKLHYSLAFEKLNWSILDKSFGLEGVKVYPLQDSMIASVDVPLKFLEIPAFTIRDINFKDLLFHQQLNGGSIEIESPKVGIQLPKEHVQSENNSLDVNTVLQHFFESFRLEVVRLNQGHIVFFKDQSVPFIELENIGVRGNEWNMMAADNPFENFELEAIIGAASMNLPDYQLKFVNTTFSNLQDLLSAQRIYISTNKSAKKMQAEITINELTLQGLLAFTESRQLGLAEIGKIQAKVALPVNDTDQKSSNSGNVESIFLEQFKVNHFDLALIKKGMGTISVQDGKADFRNIVIGDQTLPLTFNLERSALGTGTVNAQLRGLEGKIASLEFKERKLNITDLTASSDSTSSKIWQLALPVLSLSDLQWPDSADLTFGIGKISLIRPVAEALLIAQEEKQAMAKSSVLDKKSTDITQTSAFQWHLDTIMIEEARWSVEQQSTVEREIWSSSNTSLQRLNLNYPLQFEDMLTQDFSMTVSDLLYKKNDTKLEIEQLNLKSKQQSIEVLNSQLKAKVGAKMHIDAIIPSMIIHTQNNSLWKIDQDWVISKFHVNNPQLGMTWDSNGLEQPTEIRTDANAKVSFPFSSIVVNEFELNHAGITIDRPEQNISAKINGLDVQYLDFLWSAQQPLDAFALLEAGRWNVSVDQVQATLSNPQHTAEIYGLQAGASENIQWDSLSFSPSVGPLAYSSYLSHQKSWLSFNTSGGQVSGLDWNALGKSAFHAQKINIEKPQLQVFRDQRLPFPENHYPPMLHRALVNFSKPLSVDSIELHDGEVTASVQPETTDDIGSINFSNIEAIITNITNVPEEIQKDDILRMTAFAQLQEEGLLKTQVDFALNHPEYPFFMDVSMGKMDLTRLNSIVEPVASVSIKKGQMRKLDFKAIGNLEFAYGNMDFMYRKLNLSILNKKDHDRQGIGLAVESFLANELILRKNNDYPFPHRQGQLFVERDKTRSIFNYWGKIAVSGILTSAGVKSNRKALKKRFEHRRKQLEQNTADAKPNAILPE